MSETLKVLETRRSCRAFKPELIEEEKLQARIVLQVHDELLLEVPIAECEAVKTLLVEQMQSAANLRVPLEVSVSVGNSWYETK